MKNIFEDHVKSKIDALDSASRIEAEVNAALMTVSTQFAGNSLSFLLSKEEIKLAKLFLAHMEKNNYPLAVQLSLVVKSPKKLLTRYQMDHDIRSQYSKHKLINKMKWKKVWTGKGYQVGTIISKSNYDFSSVSTPVFLCSDRKLRCRREAPLFRPENSYASGCGTLPSPKIVSYQFGFGINKYDANSGRNSFTLMGLKEVLLKYSETSVS